MSKPVAQRFSALQRAENSSMASVGRWANIHTVVSVLFSEPKIPQLITRITEDERHRNRFSALQRAENSSINGERLYAVRAA